jgi:serine protease
VTRQKPDFVGPDGGNNTFLGFTLADGGITDASMVTECMNNAGFPNFFGTSAAAPHVASIAALLLQGVPSLTPTELYGLLQQSAVPIGTAPTTGNPNYAAGYGFVQADAAAANIPLTELSVPAAPTLTLTPNSIVVGSSTTITWSSANNQGCTASGSWSGAMASTGTQVVTLTAVGTDTYTLLCTNNVGPSAPTSVTLSVTAASSSGGGGGGALGLATLFGLLAMCLERTRRSLRLRPRLRAFANIA